MEKLALLPEVLQPIEWIGGKWRAVKAHGSYPTIKNFTYEEQLEFYCVGQPMFLYNSFTSHPITKKPMHQESGFLRIKPGTNQLAFMVAHNFGLTSLEEGLVNGTNIELKSKNISRMSFAKDPAVVEIERKFSYLPETDELQLVVSMATTNTPLTEHLNVLYRKEFLN